MISLFKILVHHARLYPGVILIFAAVIGYRAVALNGVIIYLADLCARVYPYRLYAEYLQSPIPRETHISEARRNMNKQPSRPVELLPSSIGT